MGAKQETPDAVPQAPREASVARLRASPATRGHSAAAGPAPSVAKPGGAAVTHQSPYAPIICAT